MNASKIRVAVVFGGKSAEYEVSLQSAKNVINALDKKKYEVTLIGVDKKGQWYLQEPLATQLHQQPAQLPITTHLNDLVTIVAGQNHSLLMGLMTKEQITAIDVVFPVIHGTYGEDGTIQGLMRMANVPFVGADVLSSAICMDKDVTKRLARDAGVPIAKFVTVHRRELAKLNVDKIIKQIGLPCFVKPANLGSSIGISKVKDAAHLTKAIEQAMTYDNKIIIEEMIEGREIECGVLGNEDPIASVPGEIIPHAEFYTYEAKYLDGAGADVVAQADLPADIVKKVKDMSIKIFRTFECDGMARVDFFLQKDGTLIFNELNTIPGFTQISQYPKMWQASGVGYTELLDKLITLALEKFDQRQNLKLSPEKKINI